MTPSASHDLAQRLERGPEVLDEDLRLLPGRKVPPFVEPVVMNELGKRFWTPPFGSRLDDAIGAGFYA